MPRLGASGTSAQATPTNPTPKVQTVSIQPEFPVRCSTAQASDITSDKPAAMASSAVANCSEAHGVAAPT